MQLAEPQPMVRTAHGTFAQQQVPNQWLLGYFDGRKARRLNRKPETTGSAAYMLGFYSGFRAE